MQATVVLVRVLESGMVTNHNAKHSNANTFLPSRVQESNEKQFHRRRTRHMIART